MRLPIYENVSKKNVKALNLNIYRNLHHHHLNTQKKNFHDEVKPLLRQLPKAEQIWIHYTIFAARNGRIDTMNVGSIVDKYFSDTMVEAGKIPDDNMEHIVLATFSFGGVCPMEGHAIATINILEKENAPMRVLLDEEDIQNALDAFVKTLNLPGATGVDLSVNDDGDIEAEVLMGDVKPKNKGGRPRGSTNKRKAPTPKPEATDAAETDSEGSGDDTDSGGSDGAEESSEEGKETTPEPAKDEAKAETSKDAKEGDSKKGNLFGDEDSPSSDSADKAETPKENSAPRLKGGKKSSIFDVD